MVCIIFERRSMPCPDKDTNRLVLFAEISLSKNSTDLIDEASKHRLENPICSKPSAKSRLNWFVICELSSPNRKVTPFFFTKINPFFKTSYGTVFKVPSLPNL